MAAFPSTQWSLVRATAEPNRRRDAFALLAQRYRSSILAFCRARLGPEAAEDATQAFLAASFEHDWWSRADAAAGSFRGFLLLLLRRHLGRWRDAAATRPAGDDAGLAEAVDPTDGAEELFDRRFVLELTAQAIGRLREDYAARGRGELAARLLPLLGAPPAHGGMRDVAAGLGIPPNTLAVELRRLRQRLREGLRRELRELCADEDAFGREWEALRGMLGA